MFISGRSFFVFLEANRVAKVPNRGGSQVGELPLPISIVRRSHIIFCNPNLGSGNALTPFPESPKNLVQEEAVRDVKRWRLGGLSPESGLSDQRAPCFAIKEAWGI